MKVDGNRFRRKRFALFLELADKAGTPGKPLRILDLGGRSSYWDALRPLWGDRTFEITLVNVEELPPAPGYTLHQGSACAMPEFADRSFDIVHSNSVIEHVGRWENMRAMASEVVRLAPHYYVQTPNFGFPYEPHFRTPIYHWLPESMRAAMLVGRKRGFHFGKDYHDAMMQVQDINMLTVRQMRELFPDADIRRERFGPLTKSIIALK